MVRAYAGSPEFGYIHLQTVTQAFINGWVQDSKRSTLLKGSVEQLERLITEKSVQGKLKGNIVVFECLEDDIPQSFQVQLNKTLQFEEVQT